MEKSSGAGGKILGAALHGVGKATGFVAAHPGVAALPVVAGGVVVGKKVIDKGTKAVTREARTIAPPKMRALASPII